MTRLNINILGISELKWMGMGKFNSDEHYIYYCGLESLRRNGIALILNRRVWKSTEEYLGATSKQQNDLTSYPKWITQHHHNLSLCSNYWCQRSWSWQVLWKPITLSRTNIKKRYPFYHKGLECKNRKSRDIWSNRPVWLWRAKASRVLPVIANSFF